MLDINSTSLLDEDKFLIENKHVGGLIFFSRNFESYDQIKDLTDQIRSIKENIIIAIDQEGGRVQRLNKEFTEIPSMQLLSEYVKKNDDILFFKEVGWLISSELVAAGIDLNFAPVLDLDKNTSSIIGDRAFSDDHIEVINMASNFIDGMHEAGMSSTGKHFPGHGGVYEDSHIELVQDKRLLEDLFNSDIKPYIDLSSKLDAVMCAHVIFPNIDSYIPSHSHYWLNEVLRNKINYKGLIFSDDLSMQGAGNDSCSSKAIKAIDAGCEMVLVCNNRKEAINVVDTFEDKRVSLSKKISRMKKKSIVGWDDLSNSTRKIKIQNKLEKIRS
tara:strand:+ start:1214 stop:2200 length:987 start_codon:yes stop_codon:yes gene_type:complete